jgi:hypothetical protein
LLVDALRGDQISAFDFATGDSLETKIDQPVAGAWRDSRGVRAHRIGDRQDWDCSFSLFCRTNASVQSWPDHSSQRPCPDKVCLSRQEPRSSTGNPAGFSHRRDANFPICPCPRSATRKKNLARQAEFESCRRIGMEIDKLSQIRNASGERNPFACAISSFLSLCSNASKWHEGRKCSTVLTALQSIVSTRLRGLR